MRITSLSEEERINYGFNILCNCMWTIVRWTGGGTIAGGLLNFALGAPIGYGTSILVGGIFGFMTGASLQMETTGREIAAGPQYIHYNRVRNPQ